MGGLFDWRPACDVLVTNAGTNRFKASFFAKIKLGRLATIEDLMGAALFLAAEAAALVTDTSLVVDGGWTAD